MFECLALGYRWNPGVPFRRRYYEADKSSDSVHAEILLADLTRHR